MKKAHDYYSFICHRSQDKPFALKLQKKIERYKIPLKLGLSTKYARHVFVDKNELRKPELKDELIEAVMKSDSLIVLCSPTSASPADGTKVWGDVRDWSDPSKTGWIGFEISRFMEKNPERPYEHIIPIVIDGDPEKGDCFHPLLLNEIRQQNLKWYDFREKQPYLDVIEAVLNPPDHVEFRKRDKSRRRKRAGVAAALTALSLTAAAFGLDYFLPHAAEYQDYVLVNEVPVGIGNYAGSGDHYRITSNKAAKTVKLEHLNGLGTPIPEESEAHPDGPMIANYKLRDTGYPDTVEYLDRNSIVQMTYAYATDLAYVTFQQNAFVSDQKYPATEENEYGIANRMNIDKYELERDDQEMTAVVRFMHGENYVIDDEGIAGKRYDYDADGRLKKVTYLSITGEPCLSKSGIGGLIYDYQDGYLSRKTYTDLEGAPVYGENGYAERRTVWEGNKRISTYFDPNGQPVHCRQWYAKAVEDFDNTGSRLSVSYYGANDEPVYCSGKYHKIIWSYDQLGQVTSEAYYGTEQNLIQSSNGYAQTVSEYDSYGNLRSRSTYGADGQLLPVSNHTATEKRQYTEDGYLQETAFYGANGQPVLNGEGYHREVRSYDQANRLTELRYFGIDSEAEYKQESDCFYHAAVFTYDGRGNVDSVSLLTTEDKLIPSSNGHWAKKEMTYSGGGQVETVKYTDLLGNLINVAGNYARLVNEYDDRGLLTSTSYYNKTGQLSTDARTAGGVMLGNRFYAKVELEYDALGNAVETRYYGEDGKLTVQNTHAIEKTEYDDAGRVVQSSYFDADRTPAKDYHTDIYFEYDKCGHLTHIDPMANGHRDKMYTDLGTSAYGEAREFDEHGNMVERAYLKADGGILLRKVTEYNDDCLPTAEMYYDGTGVPVPGPDQYWKKSIEYDEKNNETNTSYFDTDGKPLMLAAGYSQVSQKYNADNVLVGRAFLDKDGNLVNCLAGYAYCEQTVTEWRSTSKIAFYDKHERELFSYHIDYNEYGQKTAEWLAGPDGAYLNHPNNKLAMTRYFYGDDRQEMREEYYDEEGNPANLWGITSGWASEYSELGFEVKRTNLGDGFKPAPDHKQITTIIFSYDDLGREIERTFLDENGNEHNCVFGFSRYRVEYRDDGEIEHTAYWNENGEEVTGLDGSVEKVTLTMYNGDYEIKKTELGILAFAPVTYNVNRICFRQGSDYDLMLPYHIPFSVDNYAAQIISASLKKYAKAFDGDALDIKTMRTDGAEIEALLDRYLDTLREDGNLTELFCIAVMESATSLFAPYASKLPTKAEVTDFYQEFYDNEWAHTKRQLQSEYGEDFILTCQITDLTEFSDSSISANRAQFDSYNLGVRLEDMVILEVKYTVEGNGKNAILSGGLFYPRVSLLKFDGSWTLGTAEGFPAPATEDFAALFGITL